MTRPNEPLVEFDAPWSRALRVRSMMTTGALLVILIVGIVTGDRLGLLLQPLLVGLPLLIVIGALPFMVNGYALTEAEILVRRPGWITRLPLATLRSVEGDAEAMRGSARLFGNGGLFSITGHFWNRRLRRYRAYATDPSRAVVLRYPDRVVVVTPHDPQQFILRVRTLQSISGFRA